MALCVTVADIHIYTSDARARQVIAEMAKVSDALSVTDVEPATTWFKAEE